MDPGEPSVRVGERHEIGTVEPVLFIAALTALHLAVLALIDVLSGTRPWPGKLGWVLAILFLPLIGAIIYYILAGKGSKRSKSGQPPTSSIMPSGMDQQDENHLGVRNSNCKKRDA